MRILLDQSLPVSLAGAPNSHDLVIHRATGARGDRELVLHAGVEGYEALVLLDAEIVARPKIRDAAREHGVVLICSAINDPFEAETNFRHAFSTVTTKVRQANGRLLWLRRDGIRPESSPPVS